MGLLDGLKAAKERSALRKQKIAQVSDNAYALLAAGEWVKLRECAKCWNELDEWNGVPWVLYIYAGMFSEPMALVESATFDRYIERTNAAAAKRWLESHRTDPEYTGPFVQEAQAFLISCDGSRESIKASVRMLEETLVAHPNRAETLVALGLSYSGSEKAVPYFRQALDIRENYTPALYFLGKTLFALKKWGEVRDCYLTLTLRIPEDVEILFRLAFAHMQLDEFELSILRFNKVIELAPGSTYAQEARDLIKLIESRPKRVSDK